MLASFPRLAHDADQGRGKIVSRATWANLTQIYSSIFKIPQKGWEADVGYSGMPG